jgi:hypothetical protein
VPGVFSVRLRRLSLALKGVCDEDRDLEHTALFRRRVRVKIASIALSVSEAKSDTGRFQLVEEAVIPHYQWEEKTDGTHLSAAADEFHAWLDDYYALRGWDRTTGCPTRETLVAPDLGEVARSLEQSRWR